MIKRYNQFINESEQIPSPNESGSSKISLTDDEAEMFSDEPSLQKLITDKKVSLLPPELWYNTNDQDTIEILKQYFPDAEYTEEVSMDDQVYDPRSMNFERHDLNRANEGKVNEKLNTDEIISNFDKMSKPNQIKLCNKLCNKVNLICIEEDEYDELLSIKSNHPG